MNNAKELIVQQQKEALEELGKTTVALARLRKLIREQESYGSLTEKRTPN